MFCPNCGSEVRDTAKFCPSCGHALKPGAVPPRKATPPPYTPPPYTPPPYTPPPPAPAPAPARRSFRPNRRVMGCGLALLGVLLLAVVALAAVYFILGLHRRDQMTHILPAEGTTYYATISPSLRQLPALRRMISQAGDRAAFAPLAPVMEELPVSAGDFDFDLRQDVLSWVGREASVALVEVELPEGWSSSELVVSVVSRDDEEALAFAAKLFDGLEGDVSTTTTVYDGVNYHEVSIDGDDPLAYGIVADQLVLATGTGALERVIDTANGNGESFADNSAFHDAVDALPGNRLGYAYLPVDQSDSGTPVVEALRGVALAYGLTGGGARFDYALTMDRGLLTSEQIDLLEADPIDNRMAAHAPADAIIYVSGRALGDTIMALGDDGEQFLDDLDDEFDVDFRDDFLAHFPGEFALVAINDRDNILGEAFGALLLAEIDDRDAAAGDFANGLQDLAASNDLDFDELERDEATIYLVSESGSDLAVGAGVGPEHGFIGISQASLEDAAEIGDDNLAASDAFRQTMGALPDGLLNIYIDGRRGRQLFEDAQGPIDTDSFIDDTVREIAGIGIVLGPLDRDGVMEGAVYVRTQE